MCKILYLLTMSKYVLIGMRGVGKTTVAKEIALHHSLYTHYDTDTVFEQEYNTSIYSYIVTHGIGIFRKHESHILHTIINQTNVIISTGGGIVSIEDNRILLMREKEKKTPIIFLHAPLDTLYKRRTTQEKQHNIRPLLYDAVDISDEICVSWKKRKKWYYMLASHTIYTEGKTPYDIAQEIMSLS